jgi:hypothetical protein
MTDPLILYSTNTWLSYIIAERFYRSEHYVWCTPYFDSKSLPILDSTTPPTSTPCEIYHSLSAEVCAGDRHSAKIKENKVGILKGATFKRKAGVINEQQEKDIAAIVEAAEQRDFKPLLYIIPFRPVAKLVMEVPVSERAHPLSVEYVIERLPRARFDIIELERR